MLGFRAVIEKVFPPPEEETKKPGWRKPATFVLWAVGVWATAFTLASARHESALDRIETRYNSVILQMSTGMDERLSSRIVRGALSMLPELQAMRCPEKPEIWPPWSPLFSLFSDGDLHKGNVRDVKQLVVNFKNVTGQTDLMGINLSNATLHHANMYRTKLGMTDLSGANLSESDLRQVDLLQANLYGADLR